MRDATAGDPISGLKWTHKSLRKICRVLRRQRYAISPPTVSRLLRQAGYSLRVNRKRVAGRQSPNRDAQFAYIARRRREFLKQGRPVISVDTKKRELVGNFKNPGRAWGQQARDVNMYDFRSDALGIAIPYGVYDVGRNRGYVSVGIACDTAEFAVAAIRAWWFDEGRKEYRGESHLLIEADCGGSNGSRLILWKAQLQRFADETGLTITVTHYPSGASKWNPIEHHMFSVITENWAGHPLDSYETVLKYLRTTRTNAGFRCRARLDKTPYRKSVKVSSDEAASIQMKPRKTFPHWNYTIYPRIQCLRS
jgi:hypothetical protein